MSEIGDDKLIGDMGKNPDGVLQSMGGERGNGIDLPQDMTGANESTVSIFYANRSGVQHFDNVDCVDRHFKVICDPYLIGYGSPFVPRTEL